MGKSTQKQWLFRVSFADQGHMMNVLDAVNVIAEDAEGAIAKAKREFQKRDYAETAVANVAVVDVVDVK